LFIISAFASHRHPEINKNWPCRRGGHQPAPVFSHLPPNLYQLAHVVEQQQLDHVVQQQQLAHVVQQQRCW
jgi:predicted oxidoreductase